MCKAIISCGAGKLDGVHPAAELYTGSFFKGNLKAAIAEFGIENVWILSAKYGLVHSATPIESYNVKWGDAETIDLSTLKQQVIDHGLDNEETYVFAPADYWKAIWSIGAELYWAPQWVNEADKGIGYQKHTAKIAATI